nr:energy-coupling factor ABC transporter permease [Vibrio sonorensis]
MSYGFIHRDICQVFLPKLKQERYFQHLTFAVLLSLFFLWSAQAGVKEGLNIHFLALTTLTLMYGWRVAYLLSMLVSLLLCAAGKLDWQLLPEYILISCLLPILISYGVFLLSYRHLPRNIFVFIFVAGFFNGGITGSLHLLISGSYLAFQDVHDWQTIYDNYLIFVPLLAFPEGLLNGMSMAMFAVFKPEWIRYFSDRDYIYNHYRKK